MTIESGFLDWNKSQVHFHRYGKGDRLLIAFHGFGDRAALFDVLQGALDTSYTFYAIDLPFHGKTKWFYQRFRRSDMIGIVRAIMAKEEKERIELMGYSLGGRIVQSMLFELHPIVDQLYLLAPDGLRTKGMASAVGTPLWLRVALSRLLQWRPQLFLKMIEGLYRLKIISRFIYDFSRLHISTAERRDRVLGCWASLNEFAFRARDLKSLLKRSEIKTRLYFGRRDEVIPLSSGKWLARDLPNAQLTILEEGHLLVDDVLRKELERIEL